MTENYSDREIIDGLLSNDRQMVHHFFYVKCRPIIGYIIGKVFNHQAEKDELVSELYLLLRENDWYKLRQFDFRSKLTTWLSVVSTRHFIKKRDLLIENGRENTPIERGYDPLKDMLIKMDIHHMLYKMPNARYRELLRDFFIQDMEPEAIAKKMNVTLANFYNLKHRAIQQIAEILKKEVGYAS